MSLIKTQTNDLLPFRSLLTEMLDADRLLSKDPFFKNLIKVPSANIKEQEDCFQVELAVPGLDKKNFKVEINNSVLTISAENKSEKTEEKDNYTRREFSYGNFTRSFELPEIVNEEAIDAQYKDGILYLTLPKKQGAIASRKKEIAVS